MTRESYQRALSTLREAVVAMAELVGERLATALSCLEDGDEAAARGVIDGDEAINARYLDLEAECIDLFALQQPVASDLRVVTASFKIITDLERIGDLATNLAAYSRSTTETILPEIGLQAIGDGVCEMLSMAIDAYAAGDVESCFAIDEYDDSIDRRCSEASYEVVRTLLEREHDAAVEETTEAVLDAASRLLLTIRDLERVGDHAVNVAARTLYMVENDAELIY
ncbi:MAG: phosphate signaling complex protein PhoU [Halapricum sp.]